MVSLLLLLRARFATRLESDGTFVPLEEQDRSKWDRRLIMEATALLQQVLRRDLPGPYQLQAATAAIHCEAASFAQTDWTEIVMIYDRLMILASNPVIQLNRTVALSYAEDVRRALGSLAELSDELSAYQPYYAAKADILVRCGEFESGAKTFEQAIALSSNRAEKQFLEKRQNRLCQPKPL